MKKKNSATVDMTNHDPLYESTCNHQVHRQYLSTYHHSEQTCCYIYKRYDDLPDLLVYVARWSTSNISSFPSLIPMLSKLLWSVKIHTISAITTTIPNKQQHKETIGAHNKQTLPNRSSLNPTNRNISYLIKMNLLNPRDILPDMTVWHIEQTLQQE